MKKQASLNDWSDKEIKITISLSGLGNYSLTKLRLSNPSLTKSDIAKSLLEKALKDIDVKTN